MQAGDQPEEEKPVSGRLHAYDPQLSGPAKREQCSQLSWVLSYIPGYANLLYLVDSVGIRFVAHIVAGQHLLRGLAEGLSQQAIPYLFKDLHVTASKVNVFQTVIKLAYSCKVLIGFFSDAFPLSGFRQMPLLLSTSIAGVVAYVLICALPLHMQTVGLLVFLFFLTRLQASTCEVLTEAQVSVRMREDSERGPAILPFMSGGVTLMVVLSSATYGLIMSDGDRTPRAAIGVCVALAVPVLFTTLFNFHGEAWADQEEIAKTRSDICARPAFVALSLSTNILAVALAMCQLVIKSTVGRLVLAIAVLLALLVALNFILRADIARAATTYTVMIAFILDIDGASFYFFTDSAAEYPEGPHFSPFFYNAVLQSINGIFLLCGLAFYSRYMQAWTYRQSLTASVVATCVLFLPDVILFSRVNQRLHIPDELFVIGTQALKSLPQTWDYIIVMSLIAKYCPPGMEATVFALLSSFASFGAQVNNYLGAFLLECLHVEPSGSKGESAEFDRLWLAGLIAAVFPLLSLPAIFRWIPNATQLDNLLDHRDMRRFTITSGTYYASWRRGSFFPGYEKGLAARREVALESESSSTVP